MTSDAGLGVTESNVGKLTAALGEHVRGIDHIALAVTDLEASIDWYTRALGFRLIERRSTRGAHTSMVSAVVQAGAVVVVLVQGCEPESQVSRFIEKFGPGVQHFAIGVVNLDAALKQVTAAGAAADTPIIEDEGIRQVFLRRDPHCGARVELIERRGGEFSDASVQKLFLAFEENELY